MSKPFKLEKSAGFLIFRRNGVLHFLFLKTKNRFDIPKGQLTPGESELQGALRELKEETGISDLKIEPNFKKEVHYFYRRENTLIKKKVVYFLAEACSDKVKISQEHDGYSWMTAPEIMAQVKYKNLKDAITEVVSLLTSKKIKTM